MRDRLRQYSIHPMLWLVLVVPLLSVSSPMSAAEPLPQTPDTAPDFQPPELLYLTWQEHLSDNPEGEHFPVWKPDGEQLSGTEAAQLRKIFRRFALFDVQTGQHHPLLLIFKVDPRLAASPLMPNLLDVGGNPIARGGSMNEPRAEMILTSLSADRQRMIVWPSEGDVEVRYPLENPTAIKTLDGPPQGLIEIAPGVTWELDPNYAMERDPETRRLVRAENKFAGVLTTNPNQADPHVDYDVRVELNGGKILKTSLHTAKSNPTGEPSRLDITAAVEPQQITKMFILRQRHAVKKFEKLPIKRDLLYKSQQSDKSDK